MFFSFSKVPGPSSAASTSWVMMHIILKNHETLAEVRRLREKFSKCKLDRGHGS